MTHHEAPFEVHVIATPSLGNRSYLVASEGAVVAVDVPRDIDRVEEAIAALGGRLTGVLETHVHNDYVSGGLALAARHGAEYVVPAGPALGYPARRVESGDTVAIGDMSLAVIATPGHTDAHAAYAVHDDISPVAFTGGSLLLGSTGRTDLLGQDRAEELARAQYWSVRRLARHLDGATRLLPTHGFGSFCAASPVSGSGDLLRDQLSSNPAYLLDEDEFVRRLLAGLGPYPRYYAHMGPRNAAGPAPWTAADVPPLTADAVTRIATQGGWVIDVRPRADFAADHVPGSISVDASGSVATWTGWVADVTAPIALVAADEQQARDAARELARIGVDTLVGVHVPAPADELGSWISRMRFADSTSFTRLVDAREQQEWLSGHVTGSVNLPAHSIAEHLAEAHGAWIHCGVGFRAMIAASLVERAGLRATVIDEPITAAREAGLPWCDDGRACDCASMRQRVGSAPSHRP